MDVYYFSADELSPKNSNGRLDSPAVTSEQGKPKLSDINYDSFKDKNQNLYTSYHTLSDSNSDSLRMTNFYDLMGRPKIKRIDSGLGSNDSRFHTTFIRTPMGT